MIPTPKPIPPPVAEGGAPRPYAPPTLTALGTVESVTAGPDGDKNIDMIVGDDGGFRQADNVS